jgi:Ser/Thr protein kinase RdoA (MazF antagonist)
MSNRPDIISALVAIIDAEPSSLVFLRSSQNHVHAFRDRRGVAKILRITEDTHRSRTEIEDELEWLCHLRAAGLPVCAPLTLPDCSLCHSLVLPHGRYHATVFESAEGRPVTREDLGAELYFLHGKCLGQLHTQSANTAGRFLTRRKRWDEERYFEADLENYIPDDARSAVRDIWRQLQAELHALPSDSTQHGPVHLDLGYSNFHYDGERLRLYDFDNCAVGPHACDIAVALYGGLFTLLRCEFPGDRDAFDHPRTSQNLRDTLPAFRAGYESERPWREEWMAQLPLWFEFSYLRSVVHAFRMQHPVTNPQVKAALDKDIGNLLRRRPPIRFESAAPPP